MCSVSWFRYASKKLVTTSVALMWSFPLSSRDRHVVEPLHAEAAVQLVLAPVGPDVVDAPAGHVEEPYRLDVDVLLLVDDAEDVVGLGAVDEDLGDGRAVPAHEQPGDGEREIRQRPAQLGEDLPTFLPDRALDPGGHRLKVALQRGERQRPFDVADFGPFEEAPGNRLFVHHSTPNFLRTASAAASDDAGFWAVTRLRSTTMWGAQAESPSSKTAPAFLRAVSRYHAMPSRPAWVWSSSSSVKAVIL